MTITYPTPIPPIDDEDIERLLETQLHIYRSLHIDSVEKYKDLVAHSSAGMIMYGCKFITSLGVALQNADVKNACRIIRLWQSEVQEYAILHKMFEAKQKVRIEDAENDGA